MVYAHSVQRVTISGTCANGGEEWSTGFFVGEASADASNPTQTFADAIRTAWQTFFTSANSWVSGFYLTNEIKISQLGTDGKTMLDNTIFSTYATPISGTKATPIYPPQISLVATLQSSLSRGLAAKGRMYLPGIVAFIDGGGHISNTDATNIQTNLKTFLDAVNTAAPAGSRVILASAGRGTAGTGARNEPVTRIRVGNVYDTQRRRRNQLAETYVSANLA